MLSNEATNYFYLCLQNIGSEEPLDVPKEENAKTEEVEVLFEDIFIDINNVNSIGGLGDMYDRDTEFKISQKYVIFSNKTALK